jgi:hypothetical protein
MNPILTRKSQKIKDLILHQFSFNKLLLKQAKLVFPEQMFSLFSKIKIYFCLFAHVQSVKYKKNPASCFPTKS